MKIPFGPAQRAGFALLDGLAFTVSQAGDEARFMVPGCSSVIQVPVVTSVVKGAELSLIPERSALHKKLATALGYGGD